MKLFTTLIFISLVVISLAQGEDNYWYFGEQAGINFNTIPPTVLTDGGMTNLEAVDAISDSEGNLLFYTSGFWVWNKEHDIMPNGMGLDGSWTSTNTAIVKKPGSDLMYYIFTIGDNFDNDVGLKYSIVDLSLSEGLGDVTEKNVDVRFNVFEKILTVPHSNGQDIWIIVYENGSGSNNHFHAHLLTSEGMAEEVIHSFIDIGFTGVASSAGYLKTNKKFNQLCAAFAGHGVGIFDFDNADGAIELTYFFDDFPIWGLNVVPRAYGVEFSNNEQFLYVSTRLNGLKNIYQFDLENLPESEEELVSIGEFSAFFEPGIQMAPNGKIYSAATNEEYIHVIHFPDSLYPACNFEVNAVYLEGKISKAGLPTRKNYAYYDPIQVVNVCIGDTTHLSIDFSGNEPDSVIWNFNDPISLHNYGHGQSISHLFSSAGTYRPVVTVYSGETEYPLTTEVNIYEFPNIQLSNDTNFCELDSLILTHNLDFDSVLWNDTSESDTLVVYEPGVYVLSVDNHGCVSSDSISISTEICDLEIFEMYPNPTDENTNIYFRVPERYSNYGLRIHDVNGRLIKTIDLTGLNRSYALTTTNLSSGVYAVSFYLEDELIKTKKLLVSR